MSKHGAPSDAGGASLNTSDRGQPVVTYVRVGRGMVKVTKYEKQDRAVREEKKRERPNDAGSIHSFDSSQPTASVPSVKSRTSSGNARAMPAWIPRFKKSAKKGKKGALATLSDVPAGHELPPDPFSAAPSSSQHHEGYDLATPDAVSSAPDASDYYAHPLQPRSRSPLPKDNYLSPPPLMPTPPSSPAPKQLRPLRAAHSHGELSSDPHTATPDMWASIAQLESELVTRYGRGAVPQFEALRERIQQMPKAPQQPERQHPHGRSDRSEFPHVSEEPRPGRPSQSNSRSAEPTWYPEQSSPPRARTTPPTQREKSAPHPTRTFVDDLDIRAHNDTRGRGGTAKPPRTKEPSPELPEEDSDDSALAYLQALGLEPENAPKNKPPRQPKRAPTSSVQPSSQSRLLPQPARSATLPAPSQPQPTRYPVEEVSRLEQARHDALIASIINPPPAALEQYSSRHALPRPDYITTAQRAPSSGVLGLVVDPPSRPLSPLSDSPPISDAPPPPGSPARKSQRRELPPRPPPPNTFAPYAPADSVAPLPASRAQNSPRLLPPESPPTSAQPSPASYARNSALLRPQGSPMSLAPPPANAPRGGSGASQLALPLVRVRITSPPHRGALRALPALVMLSIGAHASFAAATWAQMVAYCARNAGVAIARRGGGGLLRVAVEERMAELTSPGGGRGVGDEEAGFGLGYYISVEMMLEGEGLVDERQLENSVPVATLSIPLPTTMGEVATVFRERKDIRRALS
ncbi:hypothetical protein FRC10_002811 [Ceratobasidium sp. 414]|nr:hypothetical protein FRC10_002811 [Ceratobasidium sp. 414]